MKKTLLLIAVLALIIAPAADAAGGAAQKRAEAAAAGLSVDHNSGARQGFRPLPNARFAGPSTRAAGTIQYDSGTVGTCCQNSFCVGNQFDTVNGGSLTASGSVTSLQYSMISQSGGAAFVSIFDQQTATAANPVTSASLPAVTGINTNAITAAYVGSTFLAGVWQFNTDVPAVASGTTGGQGFHGMSINDVVGTGFVRPGTFNAVMRASGNVVIPVELTGFELVEDDAK